MSKKVEVRLSDEEAETIENHVENRHNRIASRQQEFFGDSAELEETQDVDTRTAVHWIVRKTLREAE
jgi:hypothetical protein